MIPSSMVSPSLRFAVYQRGVVIDSQRDDEFAAPLDSISKGSGD